MNKPCLGLCLALFLGLSLGACTATAPGTPTTLPDTATPLPPPPTPEPTQAPTATPLPPPPTAEPTLAPTATPLPPAPTAEPTPAPTASALSLYGGTLLEPLASDDAQGHLERGLAAFEDDRAGLAAAHFTRAIELEPDLTDAYLYRGIALAVMEEFGAPPDFDRVIQDRPDDAVAYFLRALDPTYDLNDPMGTMSDPCADVAKALELAPDFAEAMVIQAGCICADEQGSEADRAARAFELVATARALGAEGVDPFYSQFAAPCFRSLYDGDLVQQIESLLPGMDADIAAHPELPGGYFVRSNAILWLRDYTIEETVDAWIDLMRYIVRSGCPFGSQTPFGFRRTDPLSASRQAARLQTCADSDQTIDSVWEDEIDLSGVDDLMAKDAEFKAKFEELQRVARESSSQVVAPSALGEVDEVSLLPGRDIVVTHSDYGRSVQFWGLDGMSLGAAPVGETISVAFSRDARLVAVTDYDARLRLWDLAELSETPDAPPLHEFEPSEDASRVAFSADGSWLAAVGSEGPCRVWSTGTGDLLYTVPLTDRIESLALAPESGRLVWAFGEQAAISDLKSGEELLRLGEPCTDTMAWCSTHYVAISSDERLVATAGRVNPLVKVWDMASGELVFTLAGYRSGGGPVAFSPDGKLLATAGGDGVVHLWDVSSGKLLHLMGHRRGFAASFGLRVLAVAFSADGKRLVTGGADGTARVWDAATGAELAIVYAVMPESSEE